MRMTKKKKPVTDADPEAVESWDNEGGAPASGDRSSVHPKSPPKPIGSRHEEKKLGPQEPCRVNAPNPAEGRDRALSQTFRG
ncbi:hypothetical protein SS37A_40190 (plasmid) [Methylocystis iwaonis]|uniref:Uncharacterized protein n=1 Tax=Methylocystis iwaonis TaxID=2885079 RepID=A0ABM8EEL4_9HYPH|nr:hypothetical protein SS37A_40190 [Methylocystis iwaonis]